MKTLRLLPSRSGALVAPLALVLLAASALSGCREDAAAATAVSAVAEPIGESECEVCGMVVREQPAPRGQVVHRDGHRAFFCSIADLMAWLAVPSPHGHASHVWVETLPPEADPAVHDPGAHPWRPAADAAYVIGVPRRGIMGAPVLTYPDAEVAAQAASRLKGSVVSWSELPGRLTADGNGPTNPPPVAGGPGAHP